MISAAFSPVCTENLIRIDCVTESPNVNGDDRALRPLPDPVRLAVQVEEPTCGRERGAPSSTDCAAAQGARSRPAHKWGSLVLGPAVSMVSIGAQGHHYHPTGDPGALASGRLSPTHADLIFRTDRHPTVVQMSRPYPPRGSLRCWLLLR